MKSISDLINEYDARRETMDGLSFAATSLDGYVASRRPGEEPLIVESYLYGRLEQDLDETALPRGVAARSREALGIYVERWMDARAALEPPQAIAIHIPLGRVYEQS